MRLNLLDFVVCPSCGRDLFAIAFEVTEKPPSFAHICQTWCGGKGLALREGDGGLGGLSVPDLRPPASTLAEFKTNGQKDLEDCRLCHGLSVDQGILICPACRRFFPIIDGLPELLPDALRDADREREFLARYEDKIPENLRCEFADVDTAAQTNRPDSLSPISDEKSPQAPLFRRGEKGDFQGKPKESGEDVWKHQKAEMDLTGRDDLPEGFFEPGRSLPFEPLHPVRSVDRMARFLTAVRHLDLRRGDPVLDLGVGYAWTTEWLSKLGFRVVGLDLNRAYLEAGMKRAGDALPPLLVADMVNPPLRRESFQGILVFDAFHHVADRPKSLRAFSDILAPGGRLVLAEPGAAHERHSASREAMARFGILEKGIKPGAVARMIRATDLDSVPKGPVASAKRAAGRLFRFGGRLGEKIGRKIYYGLGAPRTVVETIPHPYGEVEILKIQKKGARIYTSKNPDLLLARFAANPPKPVIASGKSWRLGLSVMNAGNTVWLQKTEEGDGEVKAGFSLGKEDGSPSQVEFPRLPIPRDVRPGEAFSLDAVLPAVASPGAYILEIDLLAEGVMAFKDSCHAPFRLKVTVF